MTRNRIPPFSRNRATAFDDESLSRTLSSIEIINGLSYDVNLSEGKDTLVVNSGVTGWIIIDKNGEGDVWRVGSTSQLKLTSNSNLKVKVWVF
jgi:hypothetical protein